MNNAENNSEKEIMLSKNWSNKTKPNENVFAILTVFPGRNLAE